MNGKQYATKYAGATVVIDLPNYNNKKSIIVGYSKDNAVWIAGDWGYSIENWAEEAGEKIILVVDVSRETKVNGTDWEFIKLLTMPTTKSEIAKLINALDL